MVEAYKNATSYRDAAVVELTGTQNGQSQRIPYPCKVLLQRPNRLRMQVDKGTLLCDGVNTYGFVQDIPGQIVKVPAPAKLSMASAYPDFLLAQSMMLSPAQTFSWAPFQLVLLLANDPLKTLDLDVQSKQLLDPAMIEDRPCDRVQLVTENGLGVLWIDQKTSVLRRFELPHDALQRQAERDQFAVAGLTIEYHQAELNSDIAPEAFQFQVPDEIQPADALVVPLLKLLGQPCPDFSLTDAQGEAISTTSLQGKIVILTLWSSKVPQCRPVLQAAAATRANLKNPDDVAVVAVNLEPTNVQTASLQTVLKDWKAQLPVYRDVKQDIPKHFGFNAVPVTIILDKKGTIQALQFGAPENAGAVLENVIGRLQQGEDIYKASLAQFEDQRAAFDMALEQSYKDDVYCIKPVIPRSQVSPRSEPTNLKMTRLWSCDQLKHPGNITVVPASDGSSRILVVDDAKSVVELKPDGTVAATHALELEGNELVTALRTATTADGKRYFLGTARRVQRVHLFDENLKTLLVYPDVKHPGINDALLTDLRGDGNLEMVLGYADVAGVQAADFEGKRLWTDRSVVDAIRVATLATQPDAPANILALNGGVGGGGIVEFNPQGERAGDLSVADHAIGWLVTDDLDGDGISEICVLAVAVAPDGAPDPNAIEIMGIDAEGNPLWRHPVARGVHYEQIEPVVTGDVLAEGPKQWLVATADSTITIIGADGKLVERFAYGSELSGMATAKFDGKPVLLVATPKTVEAWQVESPASSSPSAKLPKEKAED